MEVKLFPLPAVAGVLVQDYVEARLHTDHPDEAIRARNQELQRELQGSVATPYYFLVDPETEEPLSEFAGATYDADEFRAFLRGVSDGARAGARVADVSG